MYSDLRFLVLDDNPDDRALVVRTLRAEFPAAAIIDHVTDAPALAAVLEQGGFDVVVTDFQLRWTDGLTVLREVRARHPEVPVVMFTSTGTEEVAVEGMKLGLDDYVTKSPGHFLRLAVAVRGAIDRARFRAERAQRMEELARAKETAERALEQAEAAGRLKDEFVAVVSHELRTPLNAILGWASLLRSGHGDADDLSHGLETIERNARAQAQLIDDLLDVSRIVTGRMRLDVQPVELASVVEAAVETVRPAADARQIRVGAVLDPNAGPVNGDPSRLQQVVWNLVSNAVKFTPDGGRVRVTLGRTASRATITVADSGAGIAPDFLPLVFDRFRQFDPSTTRRHGGLGLGLAIVKHLVELHGGTVRAESDGVGRGASFTVALPVAALRAGGDDNHSGADAPARAARPRQPFDVDDFDCPRQDLTGVRVLVVDDEADTRDLLVRLLRQCKADARAASSAAEAIAAIAAFGPDVLVTDIGLPGEDGFALLRRLRAAEHDAGGRHIPAVALTAYARAEERRRVLLAGFQVHLSKPVDPTELIAVIANLHHTGSPPEGH